MIRFLEKKTFRQAIISIKALGFPALLFILLMLLPCQASSKQAAILDAIIDGETELSLQFIENQQSELLAKYFQLLKQSKIRAAQASVKKSIGPEICISARCLRLMSQTLGIETLFVLRIKEIDGAIQLSLLQTKNNEMHLSMISANLVRRNNSVLFLSGWSWHWLKIKGIMPSMCSPLI